MSEASQSSSPTSIPHTPTVENARSRLSNETVVSAAEVIKAILEHHPEYANKTPFVPGSSITGRTVPVDDWLADVMLLFDPLQVKVLHGRLVILGIALLEPELWQALTDNAFLPKLIKEIREEPPGLLSDSGMERWQEWQNYYGNISTTTDKSSDKYQQLDLPHYHSDEPKTAPREDLLGRQEYGEALAKMLHRIPVGESFALHLHGPWGAGKSTLLNFIKAKLNEADEWLIVDFNAWRNQHIDPPWWSLLDGIFQEAKKDRTVSPGRRFKEYLWRLTMGETLKSTIILLVIIGLGCLIYMSPAPDKDDLTFWKDTLEHSSKILVTLGAIWVAFQSIAKSFFFRSAKAAESYIATTSQPMDSLIKHFNGLVEDIRAHGGKRVIIFIDDLDRCKEQYVVDLLEGFQVIFREANVVMVVAADQNWLNACFSQTYQSMQGQVGVQGKSLGSLFTEKIFQLSAPIPNIPEHIKADYWQHLVKNSSSDYQQHSKELVDAKKRAEEKLSSLKNIEDIQGVLADSKNLSFVDQQAIRKESILRLSDEDMNSQLEHVLIPFAPFLEQNPRAMLRLVNSYGINQSLSILNDLNIPHKQLALWTILAMRWPKLAGYLINYPDDIKRVGSDIDPVPDRMNKTIYNLFTNQHVMNVVIGEIKPAKININAQLDLEAIKVCSQLISL